MFVKENIVLLFFAEFELSMFHNNIVKTKTKKKKKKKQNKKTKNKKRTSGTCWKSASRLPSL